MTQTYNSISEIRRDDTNEFLAPLAEWEIEVIEEGLSVNLGDVGGRQDFIANARVEVSEPGGATWQGLARVD